MAVRPSEAPSATLSVRQKLCLFHNTSTSAEDVLGMADEELTADLLLRRGVTAVNMASAGLGPRALHGMGVPDAQELRNIGFTALYLVDSKFASEANAVFGSEEVKRAFIVSASDAVSVAGTEAMHLLDISTQELLCACAGAPTEAHAVLAQLPQGIALHGVSASVLLDAGLRKPALMQLGYSLTSVVAQTNASGAELAKLGFGL